MLKVVIQELVVEGGTTKKNIPMKSLWLHKKARADEDGAM